MKTFILILILFPFVLPPFIVDKSSPPKENYLVIPKGSKKMTKQIRNQLYEAITKGYGKKPMQVQTIRESREMFLQWELAREDSQNHFVSLKLTPVTGGLGFSLGGPLSLTNCITTSDCECCKTDCSCSKKNGGQVDCGDTNCEEVPVDDLLPTGMTEALGG